MLIEHNASLKKYNTFGIDSYADKVVEIHNEEDLKSLLASGLLQQEPFLILGSGSNIVFADNFHGVVIVMRNKGIRLLSENDGECRVEAQAGEVWNDFVWHCIDQGWHGAENLVAIPGTVGASPVQNVGAYGLEAKDVVDTVLAYDIATGETRSFSNAECNFAYRNSVFKAGLANRYIVWSVVYRLHRTFRPHLDYKALSSALAEQGIINPTARQLAETITNVRHSKLPQPEQIGSAGSFFKNPIVTASVCAKLKEDYPEAVTFPIDDTHCKVAAGWLIEHAGWKGKHLGHAGVYEKQALVLVNCGECTGKEVVALANAITADVEAKFGIQLEKEAIII